MKFVSPSKNQSVLHLFFRFLGKPTASDPTRGSVRRNVGEILVLLVSAYALVLLEGVVNEAYALYPKIHHQTVDQLQPILVKAVWTASDWGTVLLSVTLSVGVTPLFEEVAFRLFLRYHLRYVAISLSLQTILLFGVVNIVAGPLWLLALGLFFSLLIGGTVAWLSGHPHRQDRISQWYHQCFALIYYYSAAAFGLIHYAAYGLANYPLWLAPILLIPIIGMGLMLGFVRIRYGMWYAIVTHAGINAIGIATMLMTL